MDQQEKQKMSSRNMILIIVGVVVFIMLACGLVCSLGRSCPECKSDVQIKEVEKIVYKNHPDVLDEIEYHNDVACQMAGAYENSFEIMQLIGKEFYMPIHQDWYDQNFNAKQYIDEYCIRY